MATENAGNTKCLSATTDGEIVNVKFRWDIRNISFLLNFTEPLYSSPFKSIEDTNWSWYCSLSQKGIGTMGGLEFGLLFKGDRGDFQLTHLKIGAEFTFSLLGPDGTTALDGSPKYGLFQHSKRSYSDAPASLTKNKLLKNKTNPGDMVTIVCQVRVFHTYNPGSIPISPCTMQHDMGNILKNAKFSDVTLIIEEQNIPAHKSILAARSPVFAAMFSVDMVESKQNQVTITDLEYEVAQQLLQFIYTGAAEIKPKLADRLLVAADKYGLVRLKELCEQTVSRTIAVPTAITTLIFADRMNAEHLKKRAIAFIKANMDKVTASEGWRTMGLEHPALVVEVWRTLGK